MVECFEFLDFFWIRGVFLFLLSLLYCVYFYLLFGFVFGCLNVFLWEMDKIEISLEKWDVCVGVMGGGVYCFWIGVMEGDCMGERRVWFKYVILVLIFESLFLVGRMLFFLLVLYDRWLIVDRKDEEFCLIYLNCLIRIVVCIFGFCIM